MNKKHKLLVRKILSLNKLALTVVLVIVALRTVFILRQTGTVFLPPLLLPQESAGAVAAPKSSEAQPASKSRTTLSDYAAIFEKSIFSGSTVKFETEANSYESLLEASELLGLQLSGTVTGSQSVARAIIKDLKTNMSGLYKIGDTVGGATIERIEKNSVILICDSQRKALHLYAKIPHSSGADGGQPDQSLAYKQNVNENETNTGSEPEVKALARLGNNIKAVLKTATIEPNETSGKVEGLSIKDLRNSAIAAGLGLKDGDVIQAVNNQKLTSTQKAYQVFKKARSQSTVTVNLSRDGKPETLSFPIR
jgi:type II secretion system protein C